jgi:hypothetical protein
MRAGLPHPQHEELRLVHAGCLARRGQRPRRFVERLVSHFEDAPVHAQRLASPDVAMDLQRLCRFDMLPAHEPARLVGADGQGGQIEGPEAAADFDEVRRVAGIAGKEDVEVGRIDRPATPQSSVAVAQAARAPVLQRGQGEAHAVELDVLPPVEFGHFVDAELGEPGLQPQRHEELQLAAAALVQLPHAVDVEVVVVVVRDDHGVDLGQIRQRDAWWMEALRPGEAHRRSALGKMRIGQDVESTQPQQQGGVADPGDAGFSGRRMQ